MAERSPGWMVVCLCAALLPWRAAPAQVRRAPVRTAGDAPALRVFGAAPAIAGADLSRLDGSLRQIAAVAARTAAGTAAGAASGAAASVQLAQLHALNPAVRLRVAAPASGPEVLVDAVAGGDPQALAQQLRDLGMRDVAVFSNLVGGWLPVTAVAGAAQLAQLRLARASMPRTRAVTGAVALQGDFVQGSSAVRSAYPGLTGQGVTVGVLSDSFNCYSYYAAHGPSALGNGYNGYATNGFTATYAADESSGALPGGVNILEEADCPDYGAPQQPPFGDEGRAIAQTVYAVAPGAQLAFHTAVDSEADFAEGIVQLQQSGANIILDDVGYPDEPFFQDGALAQAVDQVAAAGVAYFSAAGNDWRNSYESTQPVFVSNGSAQLLNFDQSGATTATTLTVTIPPVSPGEYVTLVLQWDQPFVSGAAQIPGEPASPGAANSLNLCIEGATPNADQISQPDGSLAPVTVYPVCTGASSIGGDPLQILVIGNPADANAPTAQTTVSISIQLVSGAVPGRVKLLVGDNGLGATLDNFPTYSPTIQGHPAAAGAAAVGAAMYFQTPACGTSPAVLEPFSSYGGDPILFDAAGSPLAAPQVRAKPDLTAPDGSNDTFLGFTLASAASGSTAWNSSGLFTTSVAQCQNDPAYPNFFGTSAATPHAAAAAALLWQANPQLTATQIIQALEATALPMAEGQAGSGAGFIQVQAALASLPLAAPTLSVSPSQIAVGQSATLTWSSYGASGCTASGSWSGAEAASGSATVTPTAVGTSTYDLSCSGPGGTSPAGSATVSVYTAASHHGGGALDALTLLLGAGLLLRRLLPRRAPLQPGVA